MSDKKSRRRKSLLTKSKGLAPTKEHPPSLTGEPHSNVFASKPFQTKSTPCSNQTAKKKLRSKASQPGLFSWIVTSIVVGLSLGVYLSDRKAKSEDSIASLNLLAEDTTYTSETKVEAENKNTPKIVLAQQVLPKKKVETSVGYNDSKSPSKQVQSWKRSSLVIEDIKIRQQSDRLKLRFSVRNLAAAMQEGMVFGIAKYQDKTGLEYYRGFPESVLVSDKGEYLSGKGIDFKIRTLVYKDIVVKNSTDRLLGVRVVAKSKSGKVASITMSPRF